MAQSLVELGRNHHTDKGTRHTYLEVYDNLLARHRATASNVLEIGCLDGDSLRLWESYFAKAVIVGLDTNPCPVVGDRIAFHQMDAYKVESASKIRDEYDVIIDDGPHSLSSMLFVVQHYSCMLRKGGILVVEDVPHKEWIPMLAAAVPTQFQRFMYSVDRNFVPGSVSGDDLLFVLDLPDGTGGAT